MCAQQSLQCASYAAGLRFTAMTVRDAFSGLKDYEHEGDAVPVWHLGHLEKRWYRLVQ